jgi:phenylacetate-coenzyme A ligase PaaK-like adenylate-forming protein
MIQPPFDIATLWTLSPGDFDNKAKLLSEWQAQNNPVYKEWIQLAKLNQLVQEEALVTGIPFLPISFFKTHDVFISPKPSQLFESSGTTGDVVSKHWVTDLNIYASSFNKGFELCYGHPSEYCIIGLLPSYLERAHSSLVYMVNHLIKQSSHASSGFYLNEFEKLNTVLQELETKEQKTILIGVSFALMDFADAFPQQLKYTIVMETGGMKGRRIEMIKPMLHSYLKDRLGTSTIHSEYGMTELLSQAYAVKEGVFRCPPWMKMLVGDEEDPGQLKKVGKGILHVIDLANIYSCAFIATEDIAEVYEDGSFSILGRADNSDRRGCSLLVV